MSVYYAAGLPYSDELYHHGIKGQKWGIRRYQNEDGTLTAAGKERYGNGEGKRSAASFFRTSSGSNNTNDKFKKAVKYAGVAAALGLTAYAAVKLHQSGALNDFIEDQKARSGMIKDAAKVRRMNYEELDALAAKLNKQNEVMRLTRESLTSSGDPAKDMAIKAGQKIISSALAGAGAYASYALVSKTFDRKRAADYMFQNPNQKKK